MFKIAQCGQRHGDDVVGRTTTGKVGDEGDAA
jgi:hypothetical protein